MNNSIEDLLHKIQNISGEKLNDLIKDLQNLIHNYILSENEKKLIENSLIHLIQNQSPIYIKIGLLLCQEIINFDLSQLFLQKLISTLSIPLSHQNKKIRDDFISYIIILLKKIDNLFFWNIFSINLSSKSFNLRESSFLILKYSIENDEKFIIKPYFSILLNSLSENSVEIRSIIIFIFRILYNRNPNYIEKLIKKNFPNNFQDYLKKIIGKSYNSKIETFKSIISKPQLSNEDIIKNLKEEFLNPLSDLKPILLQCPFSKFEKLLGRDIDWEERMKSLSIITSHAKGTNNPKEFCKGLIKLQDGIVSCLTDARSTLCKHSCLCFAVMAQSLGNYFDICADFSIPLLLSRCNHSTQIISLSSELCILKFVEFVYGKKIKSILLDFKSKPSPEVRLVVGKSIEIALKNWPNNLVEGFEDILINFKNDQSDLVRNYFNKKNLNISISEDINKNIFKEEEEIKDIILFNKEIIDENNEILDNFEKIESNILNDINEQLLNQLIDLINNRNTKLIINFLIEKSPNLNNKILNEIIEILIMEINDETDTSLGIDLLLILIEKYKDFIFFNHFKILKELPEDEKTGILIINIFLKNYNFNIIIKKLLTINILYIFKFIFFNINQLNFNESLYYDIISSTFNQGYFEIFQEKINIILKYFFNLNNIKCEALIGSLPLKSRNILLNSLKNEIPELYNLFIENNYENKFQNLNNITIESLNEFLNYNFQDLFLILSFIKDSNYNNEFLIPFLLKCMEKDDLKIIGISQIIFNKKCLLLSNCLELLIQNFLPISSHLIILINIIKISNILNIEKSILFIKEKLIYCFENLISKNFS